LYCLFIRKPITVCVQFIGITCFKNRKKTVVKNIKNSVLLSNIYIHIVK